MQMSGSLHPDAASSPPWYKKRHQDSDNDDNPEDCSLGPEFLAAASTPLHVNANKSVMIISPMKRLDKLHLHQPELMPIEACEDEDEEGSSSTHAANQTILTGYSSSDSESGEESRPAPVFIRKRKHDTSSDMVVTPAFDNVRINASDLPPSKNLSVSNITCESISKISFSSSYSTPCPSQPRKKLKFKQEATPSQSSRSKGPLLDLSGSRKVSAENESIMDRLNNVGDDDCSFFADNSVSDDQEIDNNAAQSTPISQSTPANSRAPSPFTEDTSGSMTGFSFVKPAHSIPFRYETPQTRPSYAYPISKPSQVLRNAYNNGDFEDTTRKAYEVVGRFPMSAAGLMDEEVDDLHVGDKRINDPYLQAPSSTSSSEGDTERSSIRQSYLSSDDKAPLLLHFRAELSKQEMLQLIHDGTSISAFYNYIANPDELAALLKKERLRWHPDKWVSKLEGSIFDEEIIRSLSQVINAIIEES